MRFSSIVARRLRPWLAVPMFALTLSACATLPPPPERPDTHAIENAQATPLGRWATQSSPRGSLSGFKLLIAGEDAFDALNALADAAVRTLDLQYYIVENDRSTAAILERVHAAAERGVRVRMLVDDLNTAGKDQAFLRLTSHPNIEVRLFNPFPAGRLSTISRIMASLTDLSRINRRMHSKMFVADNSMAVTGGRNLGEAYFVHSDTSNFLDLDVLAVGPVVRKLSASFDAFWNSPLAYPAQMLIGSAEPDSSALAEVGTGTPAPASPRDAMARVRELLAGRLRPVWVPAVVVADTPAKIEREDEPDVEDTLAQNIVGLVQSARQEVILISPYFVPGEGGVALAEAMRQRGVKLRVLTNSLAATDAPVVHVGYSRYRVPLLRAGVELHELRREIGTPRSRLGAFGSSQASLHVKAMVIDRSTILVGSMNMDPRSALLNSELGLIIRSRTLAKQLVDLYEDVSASSSYRLSLDDDQRLIWTARAASGAPAGTGGGGTLRARVAETSAAGVAAAAPTAAAPPAETTSTDDEPDASLLLRFLLTLVGPFAPEEML
ncbi:MAG: phospholipase D-like domain-containing protein [Burkholderiaceae bacterium]